MWKRRHSRKWVCAVIASALLIGLTVFSGGNAVIAKMSQEVEVADTISGNQVLTDEGKTFTKIDKDTRVGTTSGNEVPSDMAGDESDEELKMPVLTDKEENVNITFPSRMEVAFNPLELPVGTDDGGYSTAQIISGEYDIINESSEDRIVTITVHVEDLNGGQIIFVDSPEAVEAAGKGAYAIYLSVVSVEDEWADIDSCRKSAIPVHEGECRISFVLPANDGKAVFTFDGMMNGDAEWWELSQGIKISTIYSCETVKEVEVAFDKTASSAMAE